MNRILVLLTITFTFIACNKNEDFVPDVEVDKPFLQFPYGGGTESFTVTSNTKWTVEKNAGWITLSKTSGNATETVEVSVAENAETAPRTATVTIKTEGLPDIEIAINQNKALETAGLFILSEGYFGQNKSDIAYYDMKTKQLSKNYFTQQNGQSLGNGANDMAIYGNRLYCVVTGLDTVSSGGYIEVVNPETGVSIKRIEVKTEDGKNARPRRITFHENKAYVTAYSNSVVRFDTVSLNIDGKAALSGTFAEGICLYGGNLYVCNSGQGSGNTISVVNLESFSETETITVPQNPSMIAATAAGDIFFTTADASWSGGNPSNLHLLNPAQKQVSRTFNIRASNIAVSSEYVYAVDFDWNDYSEHIGRINLQTMAVENLNNIVDGHFMTYNVSVNPLNGDFYLGNQGDDFIGFDKEAKEIFRSKTGVAVTSKVVPLIK
jgi:hypothetical protein